MGRKVLAFLLALTLLCLMSCAPETVPAKEKGQISVDILKTGKSDCIVLVDRDYVAVLDAADEDDEASVRKLLQEYGIRRIDLLILSHYDADHIGCAAALVSSYEVGEVIGPDYPKDSQKMRDLSSALAGKGMALRKISENETVTLPDGRLRIDATNLDPDLNDESEENNYSLICLWEICGERFLFLGDAKKARLGEFAESFDEECFLVKLPHHGKWYKPLSSILTSARAEYGVVTQKSEDEVEEPLLTWARNEGMTILGTWDGGVHAEWSEGSGFSVSRKK
ncbi:MAG: MBL fold metallo-hydrolase [Clostridia bacterium]|nr:MBL fold metallo-hydrolase [Clostridia bacterium]